MERTLEKMVGGSRAAVLRSLEGGGRSVGDIVIESRLSQPNVSNHLARLRELGLVEARRDGRRVYYRIVSPDLVRALLAAPSPAPLTDEERSQLIGAVCPDFEGAVLDADHEAAQGIVDRALAAGLPWQDLYTKVFAPVLVKTGELWVSGSWTIDQEHESSNLIERLIGHVASLRVPARRLEFCDVVVACPEGERHDVGARMASDFLAADGLSVAYLGADTPNDAIVASVNRVKPAVVVVSVTTEDSLPALRSLAARLQDVPAGAKSPTLIVGGRLLETKPQLAAELGAQAAPAALEELPAAVRKAIG